MEHDARGREQQREVLLGHALGASQEDAAALPEQAALRAGLDGLRECLLQAVGVARRVVVEHHEVDLEAAAAPERVRLEQRPERTEFVEPRRAEEQDRQIARDAVRPEAGLRACVASPYVGPGRQTRVAVEEPPGQFLRAQRLLAGHPQVAQFDQAVRRGEVEGALRGVGVIVALGEALGLLAAVGHGEREDDLGALLGRDRHDPPQREDRVEHGAGRPREAGAGRHRRRLVERPAATEKAHPVGLVLERRDRRAVRPGEALVGHDVDEPAARVALGARAPRGQEGVVAGQILRLDEQLGEGRVAEVRRLRLQDHLGVARQLDRPRPVVVVGDRQTAHLDGVLGRDDRLGEGFDPVVDAGRLHLVGVDPDVVAVRRRGRRHGPGRGRPVAPALHVAHVDEEAVGVARAVAVPARERHVAQARVARAGRREQRRVAAVGEERRMGHPLGRALDPVVMRVRLHRRDLDGLDLGGIERMQVHLLDDRRDTLLEQNLDGADERIAVEPLLEDVVLERVDEREEAHPLVVSHVRVDDLPRLAVVGRRSRHPCRRVVDRLVVAVGAPRTGRVEPPQVRQGAVGADDQGQQRRVRRDDIVLGEAELEAERRHAEGAVLVRQVEVEVGVATLGDAPRSVLGAPVEALEGDGVVAGVGEQRLLVEARVERRHEVLEHRPAPRQQRPAGARDARGTAEVEPVLGRRLGLGDGQQRGQARLRRQQVVGVAVLPGHPHVVPDAEKVTLGVVERPEVHLGDERIGALGQALGVGEERRERLRCLLQVAVPGHVRAPGEGAPDAPREGAERPGGVEIGLDVGRERRRRGLRARTQPGRERLDLGEGRARLPGEGGGPEVPVGQAAADVAQEPVCVAVDRDEPLVPPVQALRRRLAEPATQGVGFVACRTGEGPHFGERVGEALERARRGPRRIGRFEQSLLEREQRAGEVARVHGRHVARGHHGAGLGAVPVVQVSGVALEGFDRVHHLPEATDGLRARQIAQVVRRLHRVEREPDVGGRRAASEPLRRLQLEVVGREPAVALGQRLVEEAPRAPGDTPQLRPVLAGQRVVVADVRAADVPRKPRGGDPRGGERQGRDPRDGLGDGDGRQHDGAPRDREPHRPRHVAGAGLGLLGRGPLQQVPPGDGQPPERPPDGVEHHGRLVGQEGDRQPDLLGVHPGVGPEQAQPARRDGVRWLEQEAVGGRRVDREGEHEQRDQRPHERRAGQDRPRQQQEDEDRRRREAAPEVVEQLPPADDRERVATPAPARVAHARQQPRQQLPVATHPAVHARGERGVARRIIVEHLGGRREGGAGVVAFEQVVGEDGVLGQRPAERVAERVDLVEPLARVDALAEQVHVGIGHGRGVRVEARAAGIDAGKEGLATALGRDRDARLDDAVAVGHAPGPLGVARPVERVGGRRDERAGAVGRRPRVGVECEHVANGIALRRRPEVALDDDVGGGRIGVAQEVVELLELAAFALPAHPDTLLRIPPALAVEEEEAVVGRRTVAAGAGAALACVEGPDRAGGGLDDGLVVGHRRLRSVGPVGQEREAEGRVGVGERVHLEPLDHLPGVRRRREQRRDDDEGAVLVRHAVAEGQAWEPVRRQEADDVPVDERDREVQQGQRGRRDGHREPAPAGPAGVGEQHRDGQAESGQQRDAPEVDGRRVATGDAEHAA